MVKEDIPELKDLVGETSLLDGRKVTIKDVLYKPLIFTGWGNSGQQVSATWEIGRR